MTYRLAIRPLGGERGRERVSLIRLQPMGVLGLVRQIAEDHDAEDDGRHGLDDEEPLPAREPHRSVDTGQDPR